VRKLTVFLFLLPALLLACGGDNKDDAPTATPTLADSASIKSTPSSAVTSAPGPTSTPRPSNGSGELFVFQSTADGQTMKGHLHANAGPKRKVVILAHGADEDQAAWEPFAQELAAKGIAAVTFDFRGYGETGGAKDPSKLAADLDVAVRFLKSQDWPLVYIVGSDIGGTAALKVGVNEDLAGIATISSLPNAGNGLDATADIPRVVEPKLFMAGGADLAANSAVLTMSAAATDPKTTQTPTGVSAHGIDLLQNDAAKQALLSFIGAP
jgi:pimeloyl-ACP methyl ester carboxylesterase